MVLPRTPETERAYSIVDILKDLGSRLATETLQGFTRPSTTTPKFTDEELMEMAFAPEAGMLKARGVSKLSAQLLKLMQQQRDYLGAGFKNPKAIDAVEEAASRLYAPGRQAVVEALRIPSREWRPLKDVRFENLNPPFVQDYITHGQYDWETNRILFDPQFAIPSTVPHEFAHLRQWNPRETLTPSGARESTMTAGMFQLYKDLLTGSQATGMTVDQFTNLLSPIEKHAYEVERLFNAPRGMSYNKAYQLALEQEVGAAEKALENLLGRRAVEKAWMRALGGKDIWKYKE
jgi:hypothetical protein